MKGKRRPPISLVPPAAATPVDAPPALNVSPQDIALIVDLCDQDEILSPYVRALGINNDARRAMVSSLKARLAPMLAALVEQQKKEQQKG